jgi:hypothetical protein
MGRKMRTTPREVLLVGSVPLAPADEVFRTVAKHLGTLAPRIPDGEQIGWVLSAARSFARHPHLKPAGKVLLDTISKVTLDIYEPDTETFELGPYGFANNAINSYQAFKRLKKEGIVPAGTRYQVTLPGPGTTAYAIRMDADKLLPIARQALLKEVQQILNAIPAGELAFQLDIAMEAEHEEYRRRPDAFDQPIHKEFSWTTEQVATSVAWLADKIPLEADLGFHICSIWHHDTRAGQDNAVLVDSANAIAAHVSRRIDYLHIPVIPEHTAEDYEKLGKLRLKPGTKLYLGLINLSDGLEGAKSRIKLASAVVDDFGIAMFCGLGRPPLPGLPPYKPKEVQLTRATPETIGEVLDLHREIASL